LPDENLEFIRFHRPHLEAPATDGIISDSISNENRANRMGGRRRQR
jgi:hypothetical protein